MDKTDFTLLKELEKNARAPLKTLANNVFLSSPATAARIEKLEGDGIIEGYTAKLSHKKLGFPIMAFINIAIHPQNKPLFYPFIQSHPNVLECYCVTGNYSMILKVMFESTESLDGFVNQLQVFGNTQTQIVFSTAKDEPSVDVEKIYNGEYPETPELRN